MYTRYFGFDEKPFTLTPNPKFIFLSKHHKEAFAHLLYGINNHYGFIELIGEVGTGKTTVLRTLLAQLQDENHRSALIFNPCLSGVELLRSINHEFGLDHASGYANELIEILNRFLLAENAEGRTVVLVIDEAQNLQPEVLEQIRLISNLETENDKLIQIILAGQPELKTLLDRPELRQLNQRIAVRYRLRPMSMSETRAYIRHRMEVAGSSGGVSFSYFGIRWIYLYTRGVPRMINILCDRALLIAYGDERRTIGAGIVTRAIREILNIPRGQAVSWAGLAGVLLVLLGTAAFIVSGGRIPLVPSLSKPAPAATNAVNSTRQTPGSPPASPAATGNQPQQAEQMAAATAPIRRELETMDYQQVSIQAFNALAQGWGARPVRKFGGEMTIPEAITALAARRNLQVTPYSGSIENIVALGLPFLAETTVRNPQGQPYCLAVTAQQGASMDIVPTVGPRSQLDRTTLSALSSGRFYLIWQNHNQIPVTLDIGERRFEIRALQRLLKQAGYYNDAIDGAYNTITATAVTAFQRAQGIRADRTVGAVTVAALTRFETGRGVPKLKEN